MKFLVMASVVMVAAARPQQYQQGDSDLIRNESIQNEDGSFQYGFETTDPIQQDVAGQIKQIGEKFGVVMQGSYSFVAKDEDGNDVPVEVTWVANENGFQAKSDAIPVAPVDPNAAAQAEAYADDGQLFLPPPARLSLV